MKTTKLLNIVTAILVCINLNAQKTKPATYAREKVQILSSAGRSIEITPFLFTAANNKTIAKQVGNTQLALIKRGCAQKTYPACIQKILRYDAMKEGAYDKMEAAFTGLKAYRIAKFNHIVNGENLGEESILVVPATENKNVAGNCNFSKDFYIIILSGDIKVL
jgi:hypothetical protein